MNPRKSRTILALALGLTLAGWVAGDAQASPIPYGTSGWVDIPAGGTPRAVDFVGTTGTVSGQGSINLGQFDVSPSALTGPAVDYTGDILHMIVYSGKNQSELVTGTLSGMLGAGTSNMLTVKLDPAVPFGTGMLPFSLNIPTVPLTLNTTANGTTPSTTLFTVAAAPIPEPASVAVFGLALASLAFYRRRASR